MKKVRIENYKVYEASSESKKHGVRVEIVSSNNETYYVESPMLANLLLEDWEDGVRTPLMLLVDDRNTVEGATRSDEVASEWKATETTTEPVKTETAKSNTNEVVENENEDILAWFDDKDKKRNRKSDENVCLIPETAVALDSSSRRYAVENGTIVRYRNLINKETDEKFTRRENFGSTNFVWDAVLEAISA